MQTNKGVQTGFHVLHKHAISKDTTFNVIEDTCNYLIFVVLKRRLFCVKYYTDPNKYRLQTYFWASGQTFGQA